MFHKETHTPDREKILTLIFKSTNVYKFAAGLVKSYQLKNY